MQIDIITCLPEMLDSFIGNSIVKRAQSKGLVTINVHQLRDYTSTTYRTVDDYQFGGGAGMVMLAEPIANCIRKLQETRTYDAIVYMTPDGKRLEQKTVNSFSLFENLIILCGHYKGVDERIREHFISHEVSIGDYVLSSGELAAAVLTDAIARLIPGVISDETSALTDSFQDGLLAPPVYTRPLEWEGKKVPDVLLGGNHAKIEEWRFSQSLERTKTRRPDLYEQWTEAK